MPNDAVEESALRTTVAAPLGVREPPRILIACMPKSGSTFLSDLISALPDFKRVRFSPTPAGGREHELDEGCLREAGSGSYVGQVHIRYSDWTEKMRCEFQLKPVVLVRSLPDAVISLRDHLRREGGKGPLFYADASHHALDDDTLEDMIVRLAAPWYVNFYMTWRTAPDALMISYEELISAPERILREVLDFAGAAVDDRAVARAVASVRGRGESRLNVGVAGRGAALSAEHTRALIALFDFYPEAANDPYVKGVRAQAEAALAGRRAPPLGRVALRSSPEPSASCRPTINARARTLARRFGYQTALIVAAIVYWVIPYDLIPDDQPFGRVDDVVILLILSFFAGKVTKRTPALRDLPAVARRFLTRTFRRKV